MQSVLQEVERAKTGMPWRQKSAERMLLGQFFMNSKCSKIVEAKHALGVGREIRPRLVEASCGQTMLDNDGRKFNRLFSGI